MARVWLILATILATTAGAVELTQATNQELLNELGRRLGTGSAVGGAYVSYTCDTWGVLTAEMLQPNGKLTRLQQDLGDTPAHCQPHLAKLTQHKSRISGFTQIGLCDHWATLYRYFVKETGEFQKVSETRLADFPTCLRAANEMNGQP